VRDGWGERDEKQLCRPPGRGSPIWFIFKGRVTTENAKTGFDKSDLTSHVACPFASIFVGGRWSNGCQRMAHRHRDFFGSSPMLRGGSADEKRGKRGERCHAGYGTRLRERKKVGEGQEVQLELSITGG